MSFLVVSRSFILKDFSVMLYSYFSPHAKSWSAQVYPGTPTFSLQPFCRINDPALLPYLEVKHEQVVWVDNRILNR